MHVLDLFNESDRNFLNGTANTISETDTGTQNFETWKKQVQAAYPQQSERIMFVSKENGNVVSAEIPGVDRSFGVFDMNTEQGKVLDEALKPQAMTALLKAKKAISQDREADLAAWEQDFKKNTASKYSKPEPQEKPAEPAAAQPAEKHSVLKARLAQLNSAIEKQKYLDFLTFKAEQKGLVTAGLSADIDTSLYVQDGAKDNYKSLNQKLDKSIELIKNRLGINKLAYKKPAAVREAGSGRDSWDSNMPGYQGDYGGAENWGRRNKASDENEKIDAQIRAQNAQKQEYINSGKFWLKQKDTQQHISDAFIGKAAANAAALELLKQQPELRGNIVITAYGPGEQQGIAEVKTGMSRAAKGHEKYGKKGMQALAKAGREGASEKKLDTIRDQHDKYDESVAGPENCWPGHRKAGTKPGTGRNAGKRVNDCEKIKEDDVAEATGDVKFDKILKGITNKKQVAKQQKADTKQQARDAFGNMFGGGNPADKLGIRKKDVGEGTDNPYGYRKGQTVKLDNGQQGRVIDIFDDSIEVLLVGGRTVTVDFRDAQVIGEQGVAEVKKNDKNDDHEPFNYDEWKASTVKPRKPRGHKDAEALGAALDREQSELRKRKEQGVAEGSEQRWRVTVGNKSGTLSHTKTFTGTKEQAIKQAVTRFATTRNPVVTAELVKQDVAENDDPYKPEPYDEFASDTYGDDNPDDEKDVGEGMMDNPGQPDSPVAQAVIRRILLQRTDLLAKYGPERVSAAVDEVADFVGDVEEIGSSDVSGWVRHVEQMLGNMPEQGVAEGSAENSKPRIRKYSKMRPDGSKSVRYEVLDYQGRRVSGQGPEGFDDPKNAKEFYYRNYDKLQAPVEESTIGTVNDEQGPVETIGMKESSRYWCKDEKRWKDNK